MNDQNTETNLKSEQWRNWLILSLRWLGGAVVGYISSFFLFVLSETGKPPLLGLIIFGQQELFESIIFDTFYENSISMDWIYNISLFIYSTLWGLIGALLLSGKRKQIKAGLILLILYVVIGFLSYLFWVFTMIPT